MTDADLIASSSSSSSAYRLKVIIHSAQKLPIADFTSSDPFVSILLNDKEVARTKTIKRNLNPVWDEDFEISEVTNIKDSIIAFCIYDEDKFSKPDVMGTVTLNLTDLIVGKLHTNEYAVVNAGKFKANAIFKVSLLLEDVSTIELDPVVLNNSELLQVPPIQSLLLFPMKLKIIIHSAKNLPIADITSSDPFVSILLNDKEVARTKTIKRNLNPVWNEDFEIPKLTNIKDSTTIVFQICDEDKFSKPDVMGTVTLNLIDLIVGKLHTNEYAVVNAGKFKANATFKVSLMLERLEETSVVVEEVLSLKKEVFRGWNVSITIHNAKDLPIANYTTSDPFVELSHGHDKRQWSSRTKTIRRNHSCPSWEETFSIPDVFDLLRPIHMRIYDDKDKQTSSLLGSTSLDLKSLSLSMEGQGQTTSQQQTLSVTCANRFDTNNATLRVSVTLSHRTKPIKVKHQMSLQDRLVSFRKANKTMEKGELDLSNLHLTDEDLNNFNFNLQLLLTTLILRSNNLHSFPQLPSCLDLSHLEHLDLSQNNLVSVPSLWVLRNSLLSLDLSRNNLTEVSSDLTDLHQLQTLRLDRNNLIDIPTGFNKLRLLRRLDLSFNDLSSSSSSSLLIALREVETMSLLQDLDLTGNSRLDPDLLGPKTRLLYDTVNISLSYFISLYQRVMATNKVVRRSAVSRSLQINEKIRNRMEQEMISM